MGVHILVVWALLGLGIIQARADYMNVTAWGDQSPGYTCEQMMASSNQKLVNSLIESDWAACVSFNPGVWAQLECYPNGTAHVQFSQYSDCSHDDGAPDYVLSVRPTIWGEPACWSGTQLPNIGFITYLRIVCYSGSVPAPGTPPPPQTNPPVVVPTSPPTQVPVQSPTVPQSPPQSPPEAEPIGSPSSPVPTAAPQETSPEASPVAPPPLTLADKNAWITLYDGFNCAGTLLGNMNVSANEDDYFTNCQDINGYKFFTGCTDTGIPYGTVCSVCDLSSDTCTSWPEIPPGTVMWDTPRCVNPSNPSISMTCSPVYAAPVPEAPPMDPPPYTPPPPEAPVTVSPLSAPSGRTPSLDFSLHSGTSCSGPLINSGSFDETDTCQTLFNPVLYATGQCSDSGAPSGKYCTSASCTTNCVAIPSNTNTWGEPVCVSSSGRAVLFTCNNHTIPPPPQADPVPEFPPISTGGVINFVAYQDFGCTLQILPIPLKADISLCQHAPAGTANIFIRVDCFYNNSIHGSMCSDSKCKSCTPLPQAPSGICVPYTMQAGLVNSIKATCPTIPPSFFEPPTTPNADPSSSASALISFSPLLLISLILMLWR